MTIGNLAIVVFATKSRRPTLFRKLQGAPVNLPGIGFPSSLIKVMQKTGGAIKGSNIKEETIKAADQIDGKGFSNDSDTESSKESGGLSVEIGHTNVMKRRLLEYESSQSSAKPKKKKIGNSFRFV